MAEMEVKGGGGHKKGSGVKKQKKLSTRVDLTPMVDLGFLLITFFMFATTLKTPKAAKIRMPKDDVKEDEQMQASKEGAMHALLKKDRVYFFEGDDPSLIKHYNYVDIRQQLIAKKVKMRAAKVPDSLAILTIKPLDGATFENFITMFDERKINDIRTYVVGKASVNEKEIVAKYDEANNLKN